MSECCTHSGGRQGKFARECKWSHTRTPSAKRLPLYFHNNQFFVVLLSLWCNLSNHSYNTLRLKALAIRISCFQQAWWPWKRSANILGRKYIQSLSGSTCRRSHLSLQCAKSCIKRDSTNSSYPSSQSPVINLLTGDGAGSGFLYAYAAL